MPVPDAAAFTVGDEVYGGLSLRKGIRERGTGYVLAVRSPYLKKGKPRESCGMSFLSRVPVGLIPLILASLLQQEVNEVE